MPIDSLETGTMHAYSRYVKREMDSRHWNQNELAKRAGLTRQVVSNIVKDTRERLTQVPDDKTITGLAKAFAVNPDVVRAQVALAMGLPVNVVRAEIDTVSDAELVTELARRLKVAAHDTGTVTSLPARSREGTTTETTPQKMKPLPVDYAADQGDSAGEEEWAQAQELGEESQDDNPEQR